MIIFSAAYAYLFPFSLFYFFFRNYIFFSFFFFFQAEDGIRDGRVTGVQTCALPILSSPISPASRSSTFAPTRLYRDPDFTPQTSYKMHNDQLPCCATCKQKPMLDRKSVV